MFSTSALFNRLNSTGKDISEFEAIKLLMDDALERRTKHLDKVHQVELRNVKAVCLKEIV